MPRTLEPAGASDPEIERELSSPEYFADPYETYRRIREKGPAYWSDAWGVWIICGHETVRSTFRDWEHFSSEGRFIALLDHLSDDEKLEVEPLGHYFALYNGLIHRDPPDHTRLRRLLATALTSRVVDRLRPRIQGMVDDLLDRVEGDGQMDVVADLALPLPATVIAELLGVPAEDQRHFVTWSAEIVSFAGTSKPPLDLIKIAQHGYVSMAEYFQDLIEDRRKTGLDPSEDADLLAMLLRAHDGDQLTDNELVSTCVTLLVGGFETTTSLITNTLHLLLTHPAERAALEDDPGLMSTAIEESLRFESPLQIVPRRVAEPVDLGGHQLEPGQLVFEMLGAANRDPDPFPDPDRFDIRRGGRNLAFGFGIHLCIGAPLARMEGPIAVASMLKRMPAIAFADDRVQWNLAKPTARGASSYNVTF